MREYVMAIGGKEFHAAIKELNAEYALVQVDDTEYKVILKQLGSGPSVFSGRARGLVQPAPIAAAASARESAPAMAQPPQSGVGAPESSGTIPAPLPGLVLDLLVREGDAVKAGQSLLIMEAMKMENQIQAPFDGTVKKIFVQKGANISEGDKMIEISRPFMTTL